MQNLIGQKFNFLTVIAGPIRKNKKIYWKCKCDCGNIKQVRSDQLKSGTTKSCGCYKNKIFIDRNKIRQTLHLEGKHFGKLTAIKATEKRSSEGRVIWQCKCDCGNICLVDTHSLQQGKKSSCGCLISKGEFQIANILMKNNINFISQYKFKNCIFPDTKHLAIFDFYLPDKNICIEYDGEQHFYYKNNQHTWNTKENHQKVIEHDQFKNKWCKQNNITLIRIPYTKINNIQLKDLLKESSFIIQ